MNPQVVVDIGNTRIKWGRCQEERISGMASLPGEDASAWAEQAKAWGLPPGAAFVLASVHAARRDRLADWLNRAGFSVHLLGGHRELPLSVGLPAPERVGLDRLLNAVAANSRRKADESALVVDAGSAVTVDWVDAAGVFRGGAIFPGLHLMTRALHGYTAQLPLVEIPVAAASSRRAPGAAPYPGDSTESAIRAGCLNAAAGAVEKIWRDVAGAAQGPCRCYLTGGDGPLLSSLLGIEHELWPEMTLEGIRLAAANGTSPVLPPRG